MIKILNTLSGQKEELKPRNGQNVGMFVCGPTVYDYSHIGHARTYVIFDVIAKYLRHRGYKVKFVMNITDIDDRIIERAKEESGPYLNESDGEEEKIQGGERITLDKIAKRYEKLFLEDMRSLKINSVNEFAKASNNIPEIIKQIQALLEKDYAYQTDDGIYFDISKFENYGKLARRTLQQAEDTISRVDESDSKRNIGDFALWKFLSPGIDGEYEPAFKSPWGLGRPGWHIEDTAISEKYLGQQYEIHCGAQDLIFPHHEAEIAQQEAASGKKPFVKYWLHSGFVTVNGQKMSKSLKNFITISDLLENYSAEALRFMIISAHYRSPIDYKEDLIKQSEAGIQRISELINKLETIKKSGPKEEKVEMDEVIKNTKIEFENRMDDDFNTPEALAVLFNFIRIVNSLIGDGALDKKSAGCVLKFLKEVDEIFGIIAGESEIPEEIHRSVQKREELRKQKAWTEADNIRDELQKFGYSLDDTPYGPLIKKH